MNSVSQLKGLKSRLLTIVDDVESAIEQSEKEKRNVRLTKAECNRIMGYKDKNYIYRLDVDHLLDEDNKIWFNDLYEWAKEHKSSRLKRMRKNIKKHLKGNL